jgi:hypothetical protein
MWMERIAVSRPEPGPGSCEITRTVIDRCVAKRKTLRYQSAAEFSQDVHCIHPYGQDQQQIDGTGQLPRFKKTRRPGGSTRGILSTRPPPVMCASPLIIPGATFSSSG